MKFVHFLWPFDKISSLFSFCHPLTKFKLFNATVYTFLVLFFKICIFPKLFHEFHAIFLSKFAIFHGLLTKFLFFSATFWRSSNFFHGPLTKLAFFGCLLKKFPFFAAIWCNFHIFLLIFHEIPIFLAVINQKLHFCHNRLTKLAFFVMLIPVAFRQNSHFWCDFFFSRNLQFLAAFSQN